MTDAPRSGLALDELSAEIRPQDDLFRHVNGAWLERTEIPDDKARWGSFHLIAEQAEKDVRAIIEESQDAEPGTETRKIGDLYTSFMDTERIAALGAAPLAEQLAARRRDRQHPRAAAHGRRARARRRRRAHRPVRRARPGQPDALRAVPHPGRPVAARRELLPARQLRGDPHRLPRAHRADARARRRRRMPRHAAERIIALETELATHHWDNVRSRDAVATYNLKTLGRGRRRSPASTSRRGSRASRPAHADAFAEVVVYQPSFLEGLGALLTDERLEDWKAWLRFTIVHARRRVPLRRRSSTRTSRFYGTQLTGVPVNRERWKRGVGLAEAAMGEAIGRVYVERHFPPAAKVAMDELVANLIEAYRQSIAELEWMSPETRERALAKLDAFTPKIGYPVKWRDYSTLEIDAADLIGNVRRAHVHEHDRQLGKVGQPIDRDEWYMTPQTVNAYYNPLMNEIVFPAAILQYPFFDADRDAAANYGGIGAVIGHEIGHGFDDQGSRFDGDGSLRDWWTDADRAAFEERTASLIAQYNALVPAGPRRGEHGQRRAHDRREHRRPRRPRHRAQGVRALAAAPTPDGEPVEAPVDRRLHRRAAPAAVAGRRSGSRRAGMPRPSAC